MFGGLEEFDNSVESFTMKPNAKRLILKAKPVQSPNTPLGSKSLSARNNTVHASAVGSGGGPATATQDTDDSFRNQIPTTASALDNENTRRVSWLHSNALEKVSKQNRASEFTPDNTIKELVAGKENSDTARRSSIGDKSSMLNDSIAMPVKMTKINAQTSSESILSATQSFLDESNVDLSMNFEPNPAGVVLKRAK